MTYPEALAYIASLEPRGWRLGLDRMEAFIRRAGLESAVGRGPSPQFIHVAGTNGKGSVTAFLQSILVESGHQTGAFFSPFVVDPRERVQINRDFISPDQLARAVEILAPIADGFSDTQFGGISEFEFKTAVGFLQWRESGCDWVALEVGLGGRLDSTNVVTPRASIVVSIGLDHMNLLGHTHAEIAAEKAGIIKPKVPVVVGQLPDEALVVVKSVAAQLQSPVWAFGREIHLQSEQNGDFSVETPAGMINHLNPSLNGVMQPHNMALAIASIQAAGLILDEEALRRGAASAWIPGRMQVQQRFGRNFVLDGAHNVDSARHLRQSLEELNLLGLGPVKRIVLLTNMLSGHDPEPFYEVWRDLVSDVHVVPISFHRAVSPLETADRIRHIFLQASIYPDIPSGITQAVAETGPEDIILVTGSFYLVGEVLKLLAD